MRKLIEQVFIFVLGFGACAVLLRFAEGRTYNGGAGPTGRETIVAALEQPKGERVALANASAVAEAAAKVEPAVVNIDVEGRRGGRGGPFDFLLGREEMTPVQGSGSGIILSGDGYVVTNNHVIDAVADRSGQITITLDNGKIFTDVRIVGRDPMSDLAVLKIRGVRGLPAARLGDSDTLRVGDWAIAVGNPLGFNSTVTLGIVSALNRRGFQAEGQSLDRVIQTDAAINPGNSGGALADIAGQVIGINTAIASSTGASVGIGFAIPINQARRIIDDLVKRGEVVRPYLGVRYQPLAQVDRNRLPPGIQLPTDDAGAVIVPNDDQPAVLPGSPADKSGLRPFDVIRAINGRRVEGIDAIRDEILKHSVGDSLTLTIWRAGRTLRVNVILERMPGDFSRR